MKIFQNILTLTALVVSIGSVANASNSTSPAELGTTNRTPRFRRAQKRPRTHSAEAAIKTKIASLSQQEELDLIAGKEAALAGFALSTAEIATIRESISAKFVLERFLSAEDSALRAKNLLLLPQRDDAFFVSNLSDASIAPAIFNDVISQIMRTIQNLTPMFVEMLEEQERLTPGVSNTIIDFALSAKDAGAVNAVGTGN